ncbi:hypothetical protein AtEden1_Chr1g0082201 [Arabidopsis thaliana]
MSLIKMKNQLIACVDDVDDPILKTHKYTNHNSVYFHVSIMIHESFKMDYFKVQCTLGLAAERNREHYCWFGTRKVETISKKTKS